MQITFNHIIYFMFSSEKILLYSFPCINLTRCISITYIKNQSIFLDLTFFLKLHKKTPLYLIFAYDGKNCLAKIGPKFFSLVQWTLNIRKIFWVTKIFLKSRFFLISNTRKPLKKCNFAKWTSETIQISYCSIIVK